MNSAEQTSFFVVLQQTTHVLHYSSEASMPNDTAAAFSHLHLPNGRLRDMRGHAFCFQNVAQNVFGKVEMMLGAYLRKPLELSCTQ